MPHFLEEIEAYVPLDEKERQDQRVMLDLIKAFPTTILTRKQEVAHLTVSAFIMNPEQSKVLMAFHNIFQSFAWTGGHADGNPQLLEVALTEAREETGIKNPQPLSTEIASLDILPVWSHVKKGKVVSSHLHLNVTYLLIASEDEMLAIKEDENSAVSWLPVSELNQYCKEPDMMPVYEKLIERAKAFK